MSIVSGTNNNKTFISITMLFTFTITTSLLFFVSGIPHQTFAQINIPTQFSKYTNEEYNIEIEYPSDWQQFGDVEAGDYTQHIAIFVPKEEIKFKEFDQPKITTR